jgi:hypothetical protein
MWHYHIHSECLWVKRSHLPSTPFDNALDRLSINTSFQAFEKFVSGMYLGEIVRNVIVSLIDASPKPLLFNGKSTPIINKHYGVDTSFMSSVEDGWLGDDDADSEYIRPPFDEFGDGREISSAVQARLERIRKAIVEYLKLSEDNVSLKDAAVRWHVSTTKAIVFQYMTDRTLDMWTGCAKSRHIEWRGSRSYTYSDRTCRFTWSGTQRIKRCQQENQRWRGRKVCYRCSISTTAANAATV